MTPKISPAGENLIIEQEVGSVRQYNRHPYPEAPDARRSGITIGAGYDCAENAPDVIRTDWVTLGDRNPKRLAATHPYRGKAAQAHLHEVQDILVPWTAAYEVFTRVDIARTYQECKRTFPGFDGLRINAQSALVSLVYNRGSSMSGPARTEMRVIRSLVPKQDYEGMAEQIRAMTRVWRGTDIYRGMVNRRNAEADLMLAP